MDTLLQLIVNGIVTGSAYGALGVGFGLILSITGRFHFAFGWTYALAAFGTAWAVALGLPDLLALAAGLALAAAVAVAIEAVVYRPVAQRAGSNALLAVFVASLGLAIAGENALRLFAADTRQLQVVTPEQVEAGPITLTTLDVMSVAILWTAVVGLSLLLRRTGLGRRLRAVEVNPVMAEAVGIDFRRVHAWVFAIGTSIGGLAALLAAMKFGLTPGMGTRPVFYAFVVAFLAGIGAPPLRIATVGVLLGLIESVSSEWVSAQWTSAVVFGVLLLYLVALSTPRLGLRRLLRPAGIAAR